MPEPLGGYGPHHIDPPEDWSCDLGCDKPGAKWFEYPTGEGAWLCDGCLEIETQEALATGLAGS